MLILYFINQLVGIFLAGLLLVVYLFSFLISLSFKRRVLKIIQKYSSISDKEISNKLERPLDDVRNILSSLSKNQKKKNG